MEGIVILALIIGAVAFLAYRARGKVGTFTDQDANPKRPVRGYRGMGGGPGNDLIDPGPTDGGTRPTE
jgi:hypothetical protein